MTKISTLSPGFQKIAQRIEENSPGAIKDGVITKAEVAAARAQGLFHGLEKSLAEKLENKLAQLGTETTPQAPTSNAGANIGWSSGPSSTDPLAQTIDLHGTTLTPGKPLVLSGVKPATPIAYVSVEMADGSKADVRIGQLPQKTRADGSSQNWGFDQPVMGDVALSGSGTIAKVTVHYADKISIGNSDFYSLAVGKDGIKPGGEISLPIPEYRKGQNIQNINTSFHAPLRQWNSQTHREEKPTYTTWYMDDVRLQRKFVDPNEDNGNAAEVDNIHGSNATGQATLAAAGKAIRITAENASIPKDEVAMTVQWVEVSYEPKNVEAAVTSFRGKALGNGEWEGKWIQPGQTIPITVDPNRKINRIEVQWSDKPDDFGYETPGKWAEGSLILDGKPLGKQREHVGSPEWQTFDNLRGAQGAKLEIATAASPLKVFEVKVYYES